MDTQAENFAVDANQDPNVLSPGQAAILSGIEAQMEDAQADYAACDTSPGEESPEYDGCRAEAQAEETEVAGAPPTSPAPSVVVPDLARC